ncbi:MAG TPA: hypothetical protein VIC35_08430 [Acidimicrobiia bacterium]|jgi:hypothetical protein
MAFVQILESSPGAKWEEMRAMVDEWEKATEGRRTTKRRIVGRDHDNPDRYVIIVFFDSYESAMQNSELPATQELSSKTAKLGGEPTFRNLDVIEDREG